MYKVKVYNAVLAQGLTLRKALAISIIINLIPFSLFRHKIAHISEVKDKKENNG